VEPVIDKPKQVARVSYVSVDGMAVYLELRNGLTATFSSNVPSRASVGDVFLIDLDGNDLQIAPRELWREESWIGVVRLLKDERVLVDVGGRLRLWPRPDSLALEEGNTVEGTESQGIAAVISEHPVRYLDFSIEDSVSVDYFKQKPDDTLSFDDFGGFNDIIDRARELVELPLSHHDALAKIGARPIKGVLFTGSPGTGKTMLARIIASKADAQFYEISGPQVLSKWYGQSEELIRKIFDDAARQSRAIVFFDELDSLAAQRSDESHEASRRIVGQLLASMDGFTPETNVVVIATTNRPQDIDIALRRPGRFDWEIHFPLPAGDDREAILINSARRLSGESGLPHAVIAEKTESWSPAELVAIWSEAALLAVQDKREIILEEDYFGGFERVAAQRAQVALSKRSEDAE
jgi:transitional endoplasmic reticulum ATPase